MLTFVQISITILPPSRHITVTILALFSLSYVAIFPQLMLVRQARHSSTKIAGMTINIGAFVHHKLFISLSHWYGVRLPLNYTSAETTSGQLMTGTDREKHTNVTWPTLWVNPPPPLLCSFLTFFPNWWEIFNQFVHTIYIRWQIFIRLSPTLTKLCHTKRDHPTNFYISLEV